MADKPKCTIELINPDDILVLGINNKWFRTFTTSSDRYPVKVEVPAVFLNDGWNLVTGDYTNVPLVGKNDATVEYKVLLDDNEVVHVIYRSEVEALPFSLTFKDTFSLKARALVRGVQAKKRSSRFQDMMAWHSEAPAAPPTESDADVPELPTEDDAPPQGSAPQGRLIGRPPGSPE